jgi:hypothetical protein
MAEVEGLIVLCCPLCTNVKENTFLNSYFAKPCWQMLFCLGFQLGNVHQLVWHFVCVLVR